MKPEPRSRPAGIRRMVKVCAWCPDTIRQAQEAALHRMGCCVTHGTCPTCAAMLRGEIERPAQVHSAIISGPDRTVLGVMPVPEAGAFRGIERGLA